MSLEIQNNEAQIYPLLLLSFVENALKHGQLQDKNCPVEIIIKTDCNTLTFTTKNKKNSAAMVPSTNIGLSNIQKRLEILYPNKHALIITNENENYECFLNLKLETNDEKVKMYHS